MQVSRIQRGLGLYGRIFFLISSYKFYLKVRFIGFGKMDVFWEADKNLYLEVYDFALLKKFAMLLCSF